MEQVLDRFLRYTRGYTTSDHNSTTYPSTDRQLPFADQLAEELRAIGLTEVERDQYGNVTATLEANTEKKLPVIGFIAHMDTSNAVPGGPVNPQIIADDEGGDIRLNEGLTIPVSDFGFLQDMTGMDNIVTDGHPPPGGGGPAPGPGLPEACAG